MKRERRFQWMGGCRFPLLKFFYASSFRVVLKYNLNLALSKAVAQVSAPGPCQSFEFVFIYSRFAAILHHELSLAGFATKSFQQQTNTLVWTYITPRPHHRELSVFLTLGWWIFMISDRSVITVIKQTWSNRGITFWCLTDCGSHFHFQLTCFVFLR